MLFGELGEIRSSPRGVCASAICLASPETAVRHPIVRETALRLILAQYFLSNQPD
jgi:hypothetical protein